MKYFAIVYLFFKRLLTLRSPFAALSANPAFYLSALFQVSKSEILDHLRNAEGMSPAPYKIIPLGSSLEMVEDAHNELGGKWPIVIKPDVGERGFGVFIARNRDEMNAAAKAQVEDYFVQTYVPGEEYGVFAILPFDRETPILMIGHKIAPSVNGDGLSDLETLIRNQHPGFSAYLISKNLDRLSTIPEDGDVIELDEILHGFRGTTQRVIEGDFSKTVLSKQLKKLCSQGGYRYGRVDYRADNFEQLLAGEGKILEVNGLASLPPALSVVETGTMEQAKILYQFWEHAYAIGETNIANGARRYGLGDLTGATWRHLMYRYRFLKHQRR